MTTTPLESLVTAALRQHAESEMNETDTETRLHALLDENAKQANRRRTLWAAGAVAATVAVVATLVWWPGLGDPESAPDLVNSPPELNSAEQLAWDFSTAYATFDRDLMASYLAEDALVTAGLAIGEDGWLRLNRFDEAVDTRIHLEECHQTQTLEPEGARVGCLFSQDAFGSQELGRGRYGDNFFDVAIHNGMVSDFTIIYADNPSGFNDEMTEPFLAWLEKAHPDDQEAWDAWSDPDSTAAEIAESLELWPQLVQEYVAAVKAGEAE